MESLTSASFHLKKLTRSMDLKSQSLTKHNSHNSVKLASLNAINRSVKYNDLSFITGQQLCKLRRDQQEPLQNPEFSNAKMNMLNIRKRYDKKNQQKLYIQNKTQRLNEELVKLKKLEKQLLDKIESGKIQVSNLQKGLQSKKNELLEKQFQKKSMIQMISFIQQDKIIYDKRKNDLELYLRNVLIQKRTMKNSQITISEEADKTLKVYQKLINKLTQQKRSREQHINSIQLMIGTKQGVKNSSVLRKSQMGQIAQKAMTDRSNQEKDWQKIYLSHKMLSKLLLEKMQKEMQKFNVVQTAFKNIKIATGVSDGGTLVRKFLNKQKTYGNLLSRIAENQKIILELKLEKQNYSKQIKLNQEQIHLFQTSKVYHDNFIQQIKKAQQINQKRQKCRFVKEKLKIWLGKNIKKLNKQKKLCSQQESKNGLYASFEQYLKIILILIQDTQNTKKQLTIQQTQKQNYNQENAQLIVRIQPFIQIQGQFKPNFEQEETNLNEQDQSIQEHRHQILKNNQKFMKQIKQKRNEAKQILIQNLIKNNKEKIAIEKPKKIQPVSSTD